MRKGERERCETPTDTGDVAERTRGVKCRKGMEKHARTWECWRSQDKRKTEGPRDGRKDGRTEGQEKDGVRTREGEGQEKDRRRTEGARTAWGRELSSNVPTKVPTTLGAGFVVGLRPGRICPRGFAEKRNPTRVRMIRVAEEKRRFEQTDDFGGQRNTVCCIHQPASRNV